METESVKELNEKINRLKDILAQKELEIDELKASSFSVGTLFDGIDEEIMVIDHDYFIKDVNRIFLEHYGQKKEYVLGKKCHEVTYQSDSPCSFGKQSCPLEKAKKTGQRVEVTHYLDQGGDEFQELLRIMYPVSIKGKALKYFVEISRDMTEYRSLIRQLTTSEKKFRTILDTATDAIIGADDAHKIVFFNNAAQRIFGYSRSEVLGKSLNMLNSPQYGAHYWFARKFLETKSPDVLGKTLSLTACRKGGEEFPIEMGLSYHEIEGVVTFTAIIRDVTEEKQLEKKLLQSERLAAVGQTVAHVAHEIKNPLMIIGGFSYQIRKALTDDKTIQKFDMISDEIARLEKLVANLGDFTKEYALMKRRADVNSVIRDVLRIIVEVYSPEKYGFEADLSPDLEEIDCDPDKLKQVFMNVIANGIEAMDNGGTIMITSEKWLGGIEIRISDNGIGISEEDLLHIFEPFYTTRKRGAGLGLSISYKIVEAHKGEILAVSTPGEGATFVIRLPAV